MVHDSELNDDFVLTGGMAMRVRGSPRFTMSDTDTSRRIREAPDRERLAEVLTVDHAELTVTPGDVLGWKPGKKLVIARPVDYAAYFAGISGTVVEGEFTFTVSWRGLIEPSEAVLLVPPGEYAAFSNRAALAPALHDPDAHLPQGDDDRARQLRFDAATLNKQQAIYVVRQRLMPAPFG